MSGIAGIINHHAEPAAENKIREMNYAQTCGGTEHSAFFVDEQISLGHQQLQSTEAPKTGRIHSNEDGSVLAVLDGVISNSRELHEKLLARKHVFKTKSHSELLAHLYEELGSECTAMLDGAFAFAVYNRKNNRVLLARDRMGQKPLLYFMTGDTLVFASGFQALKSHPAMPKNLDMNALSDFLSFHYIAAPNTAYRNVRKLPPAHQLEFRLNDGTVSIRSYWHLDYSFKMEIPFEDAAAELRSLVEKAVQKRLDSATSAGTYLSGGVDSTIITALTAKLCGNAGTEAFTIGFDTPAYDERRYARIAAELINQQNPGRIIHHEKVADISDFSLLQKLAACAGEPFGDASLLPSAIAGSFAREHVDTVFSGDGADEIFGGYERYIVMRYARTLDILCPSLLSKMLFAAAARLLPDSGERTVCGRSRRLLQLFGADSARRYFKLFDHAPQEQKRRLFGERFSCATNRDSNEIFAQLQRELTAPDPAERFSELDVHTYLPGDCLTKTDLASRAAGITVHAPFLDREVVEFAAKLPQEYKLRGRERKHILRAAFADILPPVLSNRAKKGFGVPVGRYLRREWHNLAMETLFDSPLTQDGFCNAKALEHIWKEHLSEQRDHSYLLWGLLNLALFLEREKSI